MFTLLWVAWCDEFGLSACSCGQIGLPAHRNNIYQVLVRSHFGTSPGFKSWLVHERRVRIMRAVYVSRTCSASDKANPEFVLKQGPTFFAYADYSPRNNVEFVMRAVAIDGMFLQYATARMKRNRAVVLRAIQNNVKAFYYLLPDELRRSQHFLLEAVARNPEIYREVVDNKLGKPWESLNGIF